MEWSVRKKESWKEKKRKETEKQWIILEWGGVRLMCLYILKILPNKILKWNSENKRIR